MVNPKLVISPSTKLNEEFVLLEGNTISKPSSPAHNSTQIPKRNFLIELNSSY